MTTKPRKATTRPQVVEAPAAGVPGDRRKPTSASGWKKAGQVLTLPSGNVLRVKNPGIMTLANKGLIPNSLMAVIMESVKKGQEMKPEQMLEDNSFDVSDMFGMMDNAIILMAQEPEIFEVPAEGVGRDPELLYIDDVSEEDKMFIWQWATGGTDDVAQFRRESANSVAALSGRQDVESKPKRGSTAR